MNNRIDNNISFQARLITTMNGRDKILKPVTREFEKITKDFAGDFFIEREISPCGNTSLVNFMYDGITFATNKLHNEISKPVSAKEKKKAGKALAEKLKYNLKALVLEKKHNEKADPIRNQITRIKNMLARNEYARNQAIKENNMKIVPTYEGVIAEYKNKIEILKSNLSAVQDDTLKRFNKIRNKGVALNDYYDFLKTSFEHELL